MFNTYIPGFKIRSSKQWRKNYQSSHPPGNKRHEGREASEISLSSRKNKRFQKTKQGGPKVETRQNCRDEARRAILVAQWIGGGGGGGGGGGN